MEDTDYSVVRVESDDAEAVGRAITAQQQAGWILVSTLQLGNVLSLFFKRSAAHIPQRVNR